MIQTIMDTLPGEEWFAQIRNWRQSEFGAADAWYSYLDGRDWNLTHVDPFHHWWTKRSVPSSAFRWSSI